MKNLWNKLKMWFIENVWNKMKAWFIDNWLFVINYLVIFLSYIIVYDHEEVVFAELILGLWLFVSVGYLFYKIFMKK